MANKVGKERKGESKVNVNLILDYIKQLERWGKEDAESAEKDFTEAMKAYYRGTSSSYEMIAGQLRETIKLQKLYYDGDEEEEAEEEGEQPFFLSQSEAEYCLCRLGSRVGLDSALLIMESSVSLPEWLENEVREARKEKVESDYLKWNGG